MFHVYSKNKCADFLSKKSNTLLALTSLEGIGEQEHCKPLAKLRVLSALRFCYFLAEGRMNAY
jgi:hypothetical protein